MIAGERHDAAHVIPKPEMNIAMLLLGGAISALIWLSLFMFFRLLCQMVVS